MVWLNTEHINDQSVRDDKGKIFFGGAKCTCGNCPTVKETNKMRYAVVRDKDQKSFHNWHKTREEAIEEAKRLARKEGTKFIVLKEIGTAYVEETPVKFEEAG